MLPQARDARPPARRGAGSVAARREDRDATGARVRDLGLVLCGGESSRLGRDKALEEVAGTRLVERAALVLEALGRDALRHEAPDIDAPVIDAPEFTRRGHYGSGDDVATIDVLLASGPRARYADLRWPCLVDRLVTDETASDACDGHSFAASRAESFADSAPARLGPLAGIHAGLTELAVRVERARSSNTDRAPTREQPLLVVLACDLPFVDARHVAALVEHARSQQLDVTLTRSARGLEPLVSVWSLATLALVRDALRTRELGVHAVFERAVASDDLRAGVYDARDVDVTNVNTADDLARARARAALRPQGGNA